jgi:hypothetical protein
MDPREAMVRESYRAAVVLSLTPGGAELSAVAETGDARHQSETATRALAVDRPAWPGRLTVDSAQPLRQSLLRALQ